jgi:hypothetical protein
MDVIFLSAENMLNDEEPAAGLPTMPCGLIFREARAQLYALVCGTFHDDAMAMETQVTLDDNGMLDMDGNTGAEIYALSAVLVETLAELEEDQLNDVIAQWQETEEIEALDTESSDLAEFVFSLIHLCQIACNEDDLGVYVLTAG